MAVTAPATAPPATGSLWREAAGRLVRNRAAVTGLWTLLAITLLCLAGPLLTGHAHDRVYPEYVRKAPSLAAHPLPDEAQAALARILTRARARLQSFDIAEGRATFTLIGQQPLDARVLGLVERSDIFARPQLVSRSPDGLTLTAHADIKSTRFLLGTDANGRDLLTRILIAGRVSLAIGLLATAVALVIGVLYGAVSGYLGGLADQLMMRLVDVLYALPFVFFVILLVVVFGRNILLVFLAVGAVEWLDMARIVRGQTLSIRRQEYVAAAEALGLTTPAILRRHVIPNLLGPVVVYMTLLVPRVILLESFLSFLGLGVQEPLTSWGVLVSDGARAIESAPWLLVWPSLALVATLLSLNFVGDGLRDALDPRRQP